MKAKSIIVLPVVLLLLASATIGYAFLADFTIQPWSVDAGGGTSENDQYLLSGSIGQADSHSSQGGGFFLSGGFWGGGRVSLQQRFMPIIIR
jgi:hypothetical protein